MKSPLDTVGIYEYYIQESLWYERDRLRKTEADSNPSLNAQHILLDFTSLILSEPSKTTRQL